MEKNTVVTVPYTMNVPKEGKELIDAVAALVGHFKAGGSIIGLTSHLGKIKEAVAGVDGVQDEIKSSGKDELAGYTVHKIWGALDSGEELGGEPEDQDDKPAKEPETA